MQHFIVWQRATPQNFIQDKELLSSHMYSQIGTIIINVVTRMAAALTMTTAATSARH